ncbi:unnamed protein product [Effrenium voratum]|uniref:Uncharacterized protein n=1 Tax=Effrenium voratum TaxID=2562239 RepID=A0AA36JAA0_9DINO|nr:unnamed protein product [Effrenium voratum]
MRDFSNWSQWCNLLYQGFSPKLPVTGPRSLQRYGDTMARQVAWASLWGPLSILGTDIQAPSPDRGGLTALLCLHMTLLTAADLDGAGRQTLTWIARAVVRAVVSSARVRLGLRGDVATSGPST